MIFILLGLIRILLCIEIPYFYVAFSFQRVSYAVFINFYIYILVNSLYIMYRISVFYRLITFRLLSFWKYVADFLYFLNFNTFYLDSNSIYAHCYYYIFYIAHYIVHSISHFNTLTLQYIWMFYIFTHLFLLLALLYLLIFIILPHSTLFLG